MRPKNHVSLNIYEVPKEIKKKKKDGCDNVVCLTSQQVNFSSLVRNQLFAIATLTFHRTQLLPFHFIFVVLFCISYTPQNYTYMEQYIEKRKQLYWLIYVRILKSKAKGTCMHIKPTPPTNLLSKLREQFNCCTNKHNNSFILYMGIYLL